MFQVKKIIYCMIAVVAVTACGSKKKSSSPVATAPGVYQQINGQCYHSANLSVVVDMSLCNQYNNQNGNQFYTNHLGQCVNRSTGAIAPNPSYCGTGQSNQYIPNGSGGCIDRYTGQAVNPSLCANLGGSQYYNNGYVCVDRYTGQQVNPSLCQTGSSGAQCYGYFYFYAEDAYGPYIVDTFCSGRDCSGFALYETQTNQLRYCQ